MNQPFTRMLFFTAALFIIVASASGARTEQTTTFKLYPPVIPDYDCTFPFNPGCPWPGADGGTVVTATLCGFSFVDPLPAGAIVTQLDVRVSLLSSPYYAGITGYVDLNEHGFAPAFDPPAVMGTFSPPTQQTGCPWPPFFSGGLTVFQAVMVPGVHNSAGLSKYNYRLTPAGTFNVDNFGSPKENYLAIEAETGYFDMEFAEITLHYIPPPRIDFEITPVTADDDRKILLSKQRSEDTYFSHYQQRLPGIDADRDGKIDIRGTIYDADGAPMRGQTVYLRLTDPPDVAAYTANVKRSGDNTGSRATLGAAEVVSDNNGEIHTVLTARSANAGDNYQLEATPIPLFGSSNTCDQRNDCYQSGVMTCWKRVYLEVDRMFRAGVDLATDAPAGSTRVRVASRAGLAVGTPVLFIHAPDRSTTGQPFYSEVHVIQQIHGHRRPAIVLDSPLNYDYFVETTAVDAAGDVLADAVGAISGPFGPLSNDLYDVDLSYLQPLFNSAFVDVVFLDCVSIQKCDDVPYLPHYDSIPNGAVYSALANKWSWTRFAATESPNHQHLLAGAATAMVNQSLQLGDSAIDQYQGTAPFSWVWSSTIQAQAPILGVGYGTFLGESVVHEIVHQWDVNSPTSGTGGHCNAQTWDNHGECLMNGTVTADRGNGHVALHDYADPKSEYRRIRQQPDPLPQVSSPN